MRKISFAIVLSLFIFGLVSFSWANACGTHLAEAQDTHKSNAQEKAIDMGNKICPVTGDKINEAAKATYEYQGKIYNFCCPMCIEQFKKDPDKYIKKIEQEKQTESKEQKSNAGTRASQDTHTGHQH